MRSMYWQLGILGTISAFAFTHRETKKNLCRGDRSQDLPNGDLRGVTGTISYFCTSPYIAKCYRDHILFLYESIHCEVLQGPYHIFVRVHTLRGVTGTISYFCTSSYIASCDRDHILFLY